MLLKSVIVATSAIIFSACSVMGIGDVGEATCDGNDCFKESGVCTDAITIYTHRSELKNRRTRDHWFSKDEDPYHGKSDDKSFTRINEEDLYEEDIEEEYYYYK